MTELRITPTFMFGSRRSAKLIERNLYVYKHGWLVIFSGFFEPLFYLLGIGFGIGALRARIARRLGMEVREVEVELPFSAGRLVEIRAERTADGLVTAIPGQAARDLLIWAHRVTPEGSSIGLDGQVQLDDPPVALRLDGDGRAVAALVPGDAPVRIRIQDRELSAT